jgi:hypothetical protein
LTKKIDSLKQSLDEINRIQKTSTANLFKGVTMRDKHISNAEQYGLWDEYCKLCSEIETKEEYFESENELEEQDFYDYSDYAEDYEEDYEEDHVFDLAPEGMGYEFFSDDEYLGDVGYW